MNFMNKLRKTIAILLLAAISTSAIAPETITAFAKDEDSLKVEICDSKNGTTEIVSHKKNETISSGDEIEVQFIPDEGYVAGKKSVVTMDTQEDIEFTQDVDNTSLTFVMPDSSVKVSVDYVKIEETDKETQKKSEKKTEKETKEEENTPDIVKGEKIGEAIVLGQDSEEDSATPLASAGSIATITPGTGHIYGSWGTCEFNVNTETGNHLGFCAQPNTPTPSGNYTVSILDDSSATSQNIKAAILLYIIPELYEAMGKNVYNEKDNNTYAYCHAVIGYMYSGSLIGLSPSMQTGIKYMESAINTYRQQIPALISYMERSTVYVAYNDKQDIVWVEMDLTGKVALKKVSENSSLTSNNNNYTLAGAVYGVYKEPECKNEVGRLTTNSTGDTNTIELQKGTYYVKEISPSKGYSLDPTVHKVEVDSGKTTTITSKEPPKYAAIQLNKTSSKPDVTNANGLYSLQGAVYSVYKNSACTQYVGKLVTDASGKASMSNLPLGMYWVKETQEPAGYLRDLQVYSLDLREATTGTVKTGTVNSVEEPILDPVSILLKKVDSQTGGAAQGTGTLGSAQFRVRFYDKIMTTDPAKAGLKPIRTWVFETSKDGFLRFEEKYKISGDALYYNIANKPSLPYGTVTFEEIKAPEGYLINPTIIVQPVTGIVGGTIMYQEPTQKEDILELKLTKIDSTTDKVVAGVKFRHTSPSGKITEYTTDKNGSISVKGLEYGTHKLSEISVPDGMSVNTHEIQFTVANNNKITIVKGNANETDTNGKVSVSLTSNGCIEVKYYNKPAPFDILLHKENEKGVLLADAEFTLYSDASCKTVVGKGRTNSNGKLEFKKLIVGKTYYLKETDAPAGYRIPVNTDGSDIIYKIKTESKVVDGKFTLYVNDKAYTESTGQFHVAGTKANRIADMTIINLTGQKLPETGSNAMIYLLFTGIAFLGVAIYFGKNRKRI